MSHRTPIPESASHRQFPELLALLSGNKRARVRAAVAPVHGEARVSSPQISQLVAGHVVHIQEHTEDWLHVKSRDNYEGWVHAGYLEPASGSEDTWRISLGAHVREADGRVRHLPLGARIAPGADILGGEVLAAESCSEKFPSTGDAVARTADTYFTGASYQWGGVTPWGCDCSGLVQTVFALHRVYLPRDAWQQAQMGTTLNLTRLPATDDAGVVAGDLLFFSDREDRRVTHVGVALPGYRMVHSALRRGGVACEKLGFGNPFVERLRAMFVGGRRILG